MPDFSTTWVPVLRRIIPLRCVTRRARELGCLSGAITFHPHPRAVLRPVNGPHYLVTLDERLALLRGLGLDIVAALPFTLDLARLPALEFIELVCQHLRVRAWNRSAT